MDVIESSQRSQIVEAVLLFLYFIKTHFNKESIISKYTQIRPPPPATRNPNERGHFTNIPVIYLVAYLVGDFQVRVELLEPSRARRLNGVGILGLGNRRNSLSRGPGHLNNLGRVVLDRLDLVT